MSIYLKTERLTLRDFTEADEQNLFDLDSDPEVMRYLTGGIPRTREEVHATLQRLSKIRLDPTASV